MSSWSGAQRARGRTPVGDDRVVGRELVCALEVGCDRLELWRDRGQGEDHREREKGGRVGVHNPDLVLPHSIALAHAPGDVTAPVNLDLPHVACPPPGATFTSNGPAS